MAKLKGLKKLNKKVSAQLAPFGISSAQASNEYAYYFTDESITFSLVEGSLGDVCFNEFIKERFNYECPFPFVLYLLHEVGHHKANDNIDGDIYEFCMAEKDRIETTMGLVEENEAAARKLHFEYFNLPDEIMATQWAVNYAKKHPKKIKKMAKKCHKALMKFYRLNLDPKEFEKMCEG